VGMKMFTLVCTGLAVDIKIRPFQLHINRVTEFARQVFIFFHFNYTHQVHHFQDAMRYSSRPGNCDFDIRKLQPKITMNEFLEIFLFVYPVQVKTPCPFAIYHNSIMRTYYTCKKTKSNDALPVFMFQAFIINQGNLLAKDGLQQGLIIHLLFTGM
jgi:hypothetical protein